MSDSMIDPDLLTMSQLQTFTVITGSLSVQIRLRSLVTVKNMHNSVRLLTLISIL